MSRDVFVFGSNLAGNHCSGSALAAKRKHGAIDGQGVGAQGDSYAIPTLDVDYRVLTINEIARHVANFLKYAGSRPKTTFRIVAIGCGVAGYKPSQIAPLFAHAPANCILPPEFTAIIGGTIA